MHNNHIAPRLKFTKFELQVQVQPSSEPKPPQKVQVRLSSELEPQTSGSVWVQTEFTKFTNWTLASLARGENCRDKPPKYWIFTCFWLIFLVNLWDGFAHWPLWCMTARKFCQNWRVCDAWWTNWLKWYSMCLSQTWAASTRCWILPKAFL